MIRLLDFFAAFVGLFFLWPVLLIVTIIGLLDTGSPIFVQVRVGRNKKPF
ncbi:sugar transferase, partial [Vibrio coralliirubri]